MISLEHLGELLMLRLQVVLLGLSGFLEEGAPVRVGGVHVHQLLQALHTLGVLSQFQVGVSPEVEALHVVWVHFEYLICDANNAFPLLSFMFANNQI